MIIIGFMDILYSESNLPPRAQISSSSGTGLRALGTPADDVPRLCMSFRAHILAVKRIPLSQTYDRSLPLVTLNDQITYFFGNKVPSVQLTATQRPRSACLPWSVRRHSVILPRYAGSPSLPGICSLLLRSLFGLVCRLGWQVEAMQ